MPFSWNWTTSCEDLLIRAITLNIWCSELCRNLRFWTLKHFVLIEMNSGNCHTTFLGDLRRCHTEVVTELLGLSTNSCSIYSHKETTYKYIYTKVQCYGIKSRINESCFQVCWRVGNSWSNYRTWFFMVNLGIYVGDQTRNKYV